MTLAFIGMCVCAVVILVAVVASIVQNEKPLPPPKRDARSWSINYMTDFKRWTR